MKLSIIIPVYNVSEYLERCLNSIINQTYKNLEIICINDGSTDNSLEILNDFASKDKRIKVINKKNEGVSKTRNVGLDAATGDLISFVDSDDAIVKDMYEVMIKNLNDAEIITCDKYKVVENEIYDYGKNDLKITTFENNEALKEFLLSGSLGTVVWNKIFKKDIIGKTRFNTEITNSEDQLFLYEIYKKKPKIIKYNIPKYIYYLRENSASRSEFNVKHLSVLKVANIIYDDVLANNSSLIKEADNYLFESFIIFIRKLALSTNKKDNLDYYNNARKKIISLSKTTKISKKRKLEVLILKYFNFIYPLFVKKIETHKQKIDLSKVKDDLFLINVK